MFINTVNIYFPQIRFHQVTAPFLTKGEHLSLDDIFMLTAAANSNAILVSQDKFRDIVASESLYNQFSSSKDRRYQYYLDDPYFRKRFM